MMLINQLTPDNIKSSFGSISYQRGQEYFASGRVSDLEIFQEDANSVIICATVQGQKAYEVSIALTRATAKQGPNISGDCTCPMVYNCKHVVATLFAVIEQQSPLQQPVATFQHDDPELTRWLATLDNAVARLPARTQPAPLRYLKKEIHHFYYFFSLHSSYYSSQIEAQITIYFAKVLKSGKVGAYKPFVATKHRECLDEKNKELCMALEGMQGLHPGSGNNFRGERQYTLLGEEGEAIFEKLLITGLCRFEKESGRILKLGEPIEVEWYWEMNANGTQVLRYHPEQAFLQLFSIQDIWYFHKKTGAIGKVNTTMDFSGMALLISMPKIPVAQAEKVADKLMRHQKLLPIQLPRISSDNAIEVVSPTPYLRLFKEKVMEPAASKNNWRPTFAERAVADLMFDYRGTKISEKNSNSIVEYVEGEKRSRIQRDIVKEAACSKKLRSMGWASIAEMHDFSMHNRSNPHYFLMDESQHDPVSFVGNDLPILKAQGWKIDLASDYPYQIEMNDIDEWYSSIEEEGSGYDWFGLELGITLKGEKINLLPVLQNVLKKLPVNFAKNPQEWIANQTEPVFAELPNGKYIALPADRIRHILNIFIELYDADSLSDEAKLRLSKLQAMRLIELEKAMGAAQLRWVGGERLRRMGEKLANFTGIETVQPSAEFQGELRPYQIEGLSWLQFLREYELSGILADDMGLGKTVQALSHLLLEKTSGRMNGPCLIVAPTSLMFNWCAEAQRFAPDLKVLLLHGASRKLVYEDIVSHDLVLTTYPLLVHDQDVLLKQTFYYLILDEAQFIKNARSQSAQIALQLKAKHRLCLTGTPMENHLGELWSLFHFMMPGLLGEQRQFTRLFRTPIEKHNDAERRAHLNRRVAPFLLRRTKDKVLQELPEKVEIIRHVELEGPQRDLYETIRVTMEKKVRTQIASLGLNRSHIFILEALLKLRQVCCDPRLLKISTIQKTAVKSAKLELLMELIIEMLEEGRRILLFSQFTEMLALIEAELHQRAINYVKLTGQTKDRQTPVQQFQNGEVPLFLISLKAGGTGLNLTAADTVIHYDPWWNPAVENQATDRAHRIGQNKTVFVYKLVTKGTVEEKILTMQRNKRALMEGLFSENAAESKFKMNEDDLQCLFDPLE